MTVPPVIPRFYHMVFIKFHQPIDAAFEEQVQALVSKIRTSVPGLLYYYFGANMDQKRGKGYTHCNLSVFDSSEAHDRYQTHPRHHEMRDLMVPRMDIVVCDIDLDQIPAKWTGV